MMTLRRGESLLLAIVIPVAALAGFSSVHILATGSAKPVDFLTPGILALAVMSTSLVNVSIATGFERYYGVLKRLGTTPLGRGRLIAAKTVAVLAVEVIQAVVLVGVGLALGWHAALPAGVGSALEAILAGLLATMSLAALGLLMAGTLSAYLILGLANGLWFLLLLVSGMFAPLTKLPAGLRTFSEGLPSTALAQVFRHTLSSGAPVGAGPWVVLCVWVAVAGAAARAFFRWE